MSSRFPPLAPQPGAHPRRTAKTQALHATPLPLMELGMLCLLGLLLIA